MLYTVDRKCATLAAPVERKLKRLQHRCFRPCSSHVKNSAVTDDVIRCPRLRKKSDAFSPSAPRDSTATGTELYRANSERYFNTF